MKIKIDQDGCIECGSCWQTCPDVFMEGEDGKAAVEKDFQSDGSDSGEVDDDFRDCAEEAADLCPVDVIDVS